MNNKDRELIKELAKSKTINVGDITLQVGSNAESERMESIREIASALKQNAHALGTLASKIDPLDIAGIKLSESENVAITGIKITGVK